MSLQVRIAVLWSSLTGYLNAGLAELCRSGNVQLFVSSLEPEANTPFDERQFAWLRNTSSFGSPSDSAKLLEKLREFRPHCLLISGWCIPAYRHVARLFQGRASRIMAMDPQWRATPRQWAGMIA